MKERRQSIRVIPYTPFIKYPEGTDIVLDISPEGCQLQISDASSLRVNGRYVVKFGSGAIAVEGTIRWVKWADKRPTAGILFDECYHKEVKLLSDFAKEHAIKYVLRRFREVSLGPLMP